MMRQTNAPARYAELADLLRLAQRRIHRAQLCRRISSRIDQSAAIILVCGILACIAVAMLRLLAQAMGGALPP